MERGSTEITGLSDDLSDDTLFPAGAEVPGQAQSRRAYKDILAALVEFDWWRDYLDLVRRGWDWRKAVYIAWEASPAKTRQPATQEDLAVKVLGLASDRVIRTWRERHPEMESEIALMQAGPLLRYRRDIYDALVTSASDPDPKSHADRKLALEMMGDYRPRAQTDVAVRDVDAGVVIYLPSNGRDDSTSTEPD